MEIRELTVERRTTTGSGAARRLRRSGLVPAVLYGGGAPPELLALAPREIQRILHGHRGAGVLVHLRVRGEPEPRSAILRDLQYDPVDEALLHVDFQAIRLDQPVTVEVPVQVVGEAAGVREQNGVLAVLLRSVQVSCLPTLIPERVEVDVSALRIHDVVTVGDLRLPPGVRVVTPAHQALVTVAPSTAEAAPAPAPAVAPEPEVVGERKPAAEAGEERARR